MVATATTAPARFMVRLSNCLPSVGGTPGDGDSGEAMPSIPQPQQPVSAQGRTPGSIQALICPIT
jgi:hypothetical protein